MHTISPGEAYVSLVRTSPDLSTWPVPALLEEYGVLVERRWQEQTFSAHWLDEVEADMAAIANELERRTRPAKVEQPTIVAATYVRHTVDRLTEATRKPDQEHTIWDYCHLLSIIGQLAASGHTAAVVAAADRVAADYGLPAQSVVDAEVAA